MNFAKWFFYIGLGCLAVALLIYLFSKVGIPLGKLPGDIRKNGFYFPITTSIVISIILTILLNLFFWLFRK
jgi:hypothetical protein